MALHYATAKSRQQALLKWIRQSPRIPQCKRFLKMFLPPSSGSVILSLARLRTLDRAFSSGGERFPDTEEVRSSILLSPTIFFEVIGGLREMRSPVFVSPLSFQPYSICAQNPIFLKKPAPRMCGAGFRLVSVFYARRSPPRRVLRIASPTANPASAGHIHPMPAS